MPGNAGAKGFFVLRDVEGKIGKGGLRARAGRIGAVAGVCAAGALLTACARPDLADSFVCQPNSTAAPAIPSLAYSGRTSADLRTAADHGDLAAARVLGERYERGDGVEPDLKQAVQWYETAAFVPPYTLPVYMPGYGKVPPTVMQLTSGRASPGDPVAMARLGELYLTGRGVSPDPARGNRLLSCATKLRPLPAAMRSAGVL